MSSPKQFFFALDDEWLLDEIEVEEAIGGCMLRDIFQVFKINCHA